MHIFNSQNIYTPFQLLKDITQIPLVKLPGAFYGNLRYKFHSHLNLVT